MMQAFSKGRFKLAGLSRGPMMLSATGTLTRGPDASPKRKERKSSYFVQRSLQSTHANPLAPAVSSIAPSSVYRASTAVSSM